MSFELEDVTPREGVETVRNFLTQRSGSILACLIELKRDNIPMTIVATDKQVRVAFIDQALSKTPTDCVRRELSGIGNYRVRITFKIVRD